MTIALQYVNVTVNDVDESIAFYGEALGLEVVNDVASGGFRWVTLGNKKQPGLGIVLSEPHAGRSQENGDAIQELLVKGEMPMLVFMADDLIAQPPTGPHRAGSEKRPGCRRRSVVA